MKAGKLFFAMLLATGLIASSGKSEAAISVDFFYEHLEPHGSWFEMDHYGYVWQPHDVDADWYPYGDGRWVYTDAGWTWVSNEPFGWAVYHYGRWSHVHEIGWVWIPGTEWGPGWVSWRRGSNYVGWAPLPPEADFVVRIGFNSWVDRYYDIGPAHYRFVEIGNLGAPRLNAVFVDRRQNISIINHTTNITNITYRDNVVYNGGPAFDEISRASREPIPRYRLDRRREVAGEGRVEERQLRAQVEGDTLRVVDLPLSPSTQERPPKAARKIENAEIDRGWRDAGSPEEVAAVRKRIQGEGELPAGLPEKSAAPDSVREKGKPARRPLPDLSQPTERPDPADPDATGKGRMKGERPELPPATPGLPPTPRVPGKGKAPAEENLPPEPGARRPKGERSDPKTGPGNPPVNQPGQVPEERRESKGTKKDPAAPGTQVEPVLPNPATPLRPRPTAPGQENGRDAGNLPAPSANPPQKRTENGTEPPGQNQSGVPSAPPPPPGGSATPPLPPEPEPRGPGDRPEPPRPPRKDKAGDRTPPEDRPVPPPGEGRFSPAPRSVGQCSCRAAQKREGKAVVAALPPRRHEKEDSIGEG